MAHGAARGRRERGAALSRARLEDHRRIWSAKPVLQGVYEPWFDALLAQAGARDVLEIGAGPGFLSAHARRRRPDLRWIATDIIAAPWNDVAADAGRLPFSGASFDTVVCLDLVHHLARPRDFFAEAARVLGWPDAEVQAIALAALTMNVSMRRLQDQLAAQDMPLSDAVRAQIREHPQRSVDMLQAAGVHDTGWLETVRRHHDDDCGASAAAGAAHGDEPCRAAQLLRRVDIFAAKLSRRVTRVPMSPVQAAREACLGRDGKPDALGAALLKTVGLYPPGSFVELASGEQAIVVSRGSQTNQPLVAALVGASGAPLGEPTLRHTAERPHAVRGALACGAVRVIPPHERVLALL